MESGCETAQSIQQSTQALAHDSARRNESHTSGACMEAEVSMGADIIAEVRAWHIQICVPRT